MAQNFYQILNVSEQATQEEIKKSYRRLARQFHPDVADTPETENQFKEINRAYDTLSNPLNRADYDAKLHPATAAQTETEESRAKPEETGSGSNFSRLSASTIIFLFAAAAIEFFLRWLFPQASLSQGLLYLPGLALGLVFGLMWGADNNFDIASILGTGIWGRLYTFLRSLVFTLTLAYFLGLIGGYLDLFLYDKISIFTPILIMIGIIIGATLGSSGETSLKISDHEGKFELFYTMLRGLEVGLIAAVVGAGIGLILIRLGYPSGVIFWGIFFGFGLGMIAGSINPSNLTAYASYVSASLKNALIGLLIIGALILGLTVGAVFSGTIASIFAIISEGIMKIFN